VFWWRACFVEGVRLLKTMSPQSSAVQWFWRHADEFNLDISKTSFSGFSAGGNLTYAVSISLHEELEHLAKENKLEGIKAGKLASLVVFCGRHVPSERDASNPNLIPVIPPVLFKLFDELYLYPTMNMTSPLLSLGIASDELFGDTFPAQLGMINCGGDQLLAESERLKKRLEGLGKKVAGCIVEGVGHAWDKKPTFKKGDVKRDEAYEFAVKALQESIRLLISLAWVPETCHFPTPVSVSNVCSRLLCHPKFASPVTVLRD
jgi:putative ergosteryl-3beta-O-L-aspartate hydrolase